MKQIRYDVRKANDMGVMQHPISVMNALGFDLIAAVPQSLGDQWWFTVENFAEEVAGFYKMPAYCEEMNYDYEYWHGTGRGTFNSKGVWRGYDVGLELADAYLKSFANPNLPHQSWTDAFRK